MPVAFSGASTEARSPTITIARWFRSMYCFATRARSLAVRERRSNAVTVCMLLANVGVESRLKIATQNVVEHLQRKIIRSIPRRSRHADGEDRLSRTGFVYEVDSRRPTFGRLRI